MPVATTEQGLAEELRAQINLRRELKRTITALKEAFAKQKTPSGKPVSEVEMTSVFMGDYIPRFVYRLALSGEGEADAHRSRGHAFHVEAKEAFIPEYAWEECLVDVTAEIMSGVARDLACLARLPFSAWEDGEQALTIRFPTRGGRFGMALEQWLIGDAEPSVEGAWSLDDFLANSPGGYATSLRRVAEEMRNREVASATLVMHNVLGADSPADEEDFEFDALDARGRGIASGEYVLEDLVDLARRAGELLGRDPWWGGHHRRHRVAYGSVKTHGHRRNHRPPARSGAALPDRSGSGCAEETATQRVPGGNRGNRGAARRDPLIPTGNRKIAAASLSFLADSASQPTEFGSNSASAMQSMPAACGGRSEAAPGRKGAPRAPLAMAHSSEVKALLRTSGCSSILLARKVVARSAHTGRPPVPRARAE